MAHRIFHSQAEVAEYVAYLDAGWPMRAQIAAQIGDQITAHVTGQINGHQQDSANKPPHIVELCCGPGQLATALLPRFPTAHYTGLDISAPSLEFASKQLQTDAPRVSFIQADLNQDQWTEQINPPIHAIVSMQSMHDLGGEPEVARIYRLASRLLSPGGIFINADLLASTVEIPGSNPGRLTVPRHIELLHESGFASARCTLDIDGFATIVAAQ